jgi:hypothetical protein
MGKVRFLLALLKMGIRFRNSELFRCLLDESSNFFDFLREIFFILFAVIFGLHPIIVVPVIFGFSAIFLKM